MTIVYRESSILTTCIVFKEFNNSSTVHFFNCICSSTSLSMTSLMSDGGVQICTRKIYISFKVNEKCGKGTERRCMPNLAFVEFLEKDLLYDEGKEYFRHMHSVIIHKDGTLTGEDYCLKLTNDLESPEGKTCKVLLFSMFLISDNPTYIIKDTFKNFTKSDVIQFGFDDYRYKYFHYLSGMYAFPTTLDIDQPENNMKAPMTPHEFCKMKKYYPHVLRQLKERKVEKRLEASTSSSNIVRKVSSLEDLL